MLVYDLITATRFIGALPFLLLAAILPFVHKGKVRSAVYERSRWLIAAATFLLGVQFAIQFVGHLREQSVTLCWTVNLLAYVIATPLYNMAELNLLRAGHNMELRYRRSCIFIALCYTVFTIGYFTDTLINDQQPWLTATFLVACLYFCNLLELSRQLGKEIREADSRMTDEELSQRHNALRFTARVMKWIILFSLFSPWVGMSSSLLLNSLYGIVIFALLLIFIGQFILYGWNMAECIRVNDEIARAVAAEAENQNEHIRQRVEQWVSRRRFADPSLTISGALQEMDITATALNYYLEQHTNVENYRKWLPHLRIEEAKRYMLEHPDYSLQAIAEECGYANSSNFSRTFKKQEGMTPGQWLSKQKEQ